MANWLQHLLDAILGTSPKAPPAKPPGARPPGVLVPPPTKPPGGATIPPTPGAGAQYLALANALRAHVGMPPMALDPKLNAVAQSWADRMAAIHVLSHDGWPGRIEAVYPNTPSSENVASGWPDTPPYFKGADFDVNAAFQAWVQSTGHYANLVGDWTITGIGAAAAKDGTMFYSAEYAKR